MFTHITIVRTGHRVNDPRPYFKRGRPAEQDKSLIDYSLSCSLLPHGVAVEDVFSMVWPTLDGSLAGLVPARVSVVAWKTITMLLIQCRAQPMCFSAHVCVHPWFPGMAAVLVAGLGEVSSRCYACTSLTLYLSWPEFESPLSLPWLSCWGPFWSMHHTCHFACCFDTWKWAHCVPRELLTMRIGICCSDPCVWLATGGFTVFFPPGSRCFLSLYNFQVYMIHLYMILSYIRRNPRYDFQGYADSY